MSIVRFDPFRDLTAFRDDVNRLLSRSFDRAGDTRTWTPPIDVIERADAVVLTVELPGLSADDVQVEIDDNVLTVSGERKFTETVDDDRYYRIERSYGAFRRSLTMPQGIKEDAVQARFTDGVLQVTVPKADVIAPRKVTIESGASA